MKKDYVALFFTIIALILFLSTPVSSHKSENKIEKLQKTDVSEDYTKLLQKQYILPSYLPDSSYKDLYNHYFPLLNAIAQVESEGNPFANSGNGDSGLFQQRKISVDEANRLVGEKIYKYQDRYNPDKQVQMFLIIQRKHNPSGDFQLASRIWNGFDKSMTNPKTLVYWKKVKKAMNEEYNYEHLWNDQYLAENK